MGKILMAVALLVVLGALFVGAIVPLTTHSKTTATTGEAKLDGIDSQVNTLSTPIP